MPNLYLFNTITRQKQLFTPITQGKVKIYSCGPTVYASPHIGNLRAYVFSDLLRRSLKFFGFAVTQVMNITDVGHLTTDADSGEDKLEKSARAAKLDPLTIAQKYEQEFLNDLTELNILKPTYLPRASEHISEQIKLIKILTTKGYTYKTDDGIYFDTSKFKNYGKLSGQNLAEKAVGARVAVNFAKRNPTDFALWKFCVKENKNHILRWDFETGENLSKNKNPKSKIQPGFPGWHIECSAMSLKYLTDQEQKTTNIQKPIIDIHTGGIDHIPVHHENEIAQSEAATGQKFVNFWMHNEFLIINNGKMSKSLGNLFTIADLKSRGFESLAFRYFCLKASYRKKLNFTFEALKNAAHDLQNLREIFQNLPATGEPLDSAVAEFFTVLADDLNSPRALAIIWSVAKNNKIAPEVKRATLEKFDQVFGLDLSRGPAEIKIKLSPEQSKLLAERKIARQKKNWQRADEIRVEFLAQGLEIEDTVKGQILKKILNVGL
jgi:cysteinyl-tRNA synthetase